MINNYKELDEIPRPSPRKIQKTLLQNYSLFLFNLTVSGHMGKLKLGGGGDDSLAIS